MKSDVSILGPVNTSIPIRSPVKERMPISEQTQEHREAETHYKCEWLNSGVGTQWAVYEAAKTRALPALSKQELMDVLKKLQSNDGAAHK